MTTGTLMFYRGIGGIVLGVVLGLICLRVFPKQRKKMLERLSQE